MGRDDNPRRLVACRIRGRQNRRRQVGKTLADARAGFHAKMPLTRNRRGHGVGHRHLLRPQLIVRKPPSDRTLRSKNIRDGDVR
jgi:hypothetical protein